MDNWNQFKLIETGTAHLKKNILCQDYIEIAQSNNMTIVVLSDGLGSKNHSDIAAKCVVQFMVKFLYQNSYTTNNDILFRNDVINGCIESITQYAKTKGLDISQMDCTLQFVVIKSSTILAGQLGDGAICILKSKGVSELLCVPQKGAVANSTVSLFNHNAKNQLYLKQMNLSDINAIIATSDGLEKEFYYPDSTEIRKQASDYATIVSTLPMDQAESLIRRQITKLQRAGASDDLSLVILVRPNIEVILPENPYWLCSCKQRNDIRITRCQKCHADFMTIYSAFDFSAVDKVKLFRFFNRYSEIMQRVITVQHDKSLQTDTPNLIHPLSVNPYWRCICNHRNNLQITCCQKCQIDFTSIYSDFDFSNIDKVTIFRFLNRYDEITHQDNAKPHDNFLRADQTSVSIPPLSIEDLHTNPLPSSAPSQTKNPWPTNLIIVLVVFMIIGTVWYFVKPTSSIVLKTAPSPTQETVPSIKQKTIYMPGHFTQIASLIDTYGTYNRVFVVDVKGYIAYSDGSYYFGEIKSLRPHGIGTIYYPDGTYLTGIFVYGVKHGKFTKGDIYGYTSDIQYTPDSSDN